MTNKVEGITQQYWRISIAFENRVEGDSTITTTAATRQLGQALKELNPHRIIAHRISALQQNIITGGKSRCQVNLQTPAIPHSQLIRPIKP